MINIDNFRKQYATISEIADELLGLSQSFSDVGNVIMSDKLYIMAFDLKYANDEINNEIGTTVNNMVKESEIATANMVKASLMSSGVQT